MGLIFLLLLASTKALPVKEAFKDDIDQDLVIGSSCALGAQQANGSFNLDQIEECGYCWEDVGDLEEIQQAEICIDKFFPEIGAACESVLSKTDTDNMIREVFACFWEYVLDNDPEGLVQEEVRSYLGEINNQEILDEVGEVDEVGEAEYIIGTSCTIEAFDDSGEINETKIEECGRCWEAAGDALSETGLPLARNCVQEFMPNVGEFCKEVLDELQVGDYEKGKEAFNCFLEYVELVDEGGEIQAGVGRYLEESLDSDFVIATSCTIEAIEFGQALGDGFDLEEGVAACSSCFEEVPDLVTKDGLERAATCRRNFTPRIDEVCPQGELGNLDEQRRVLRCFYDFVLDNDLDEAVQIGVRDYLDSSRK